MPLNRLSKVLSAAVADGQLTTAEAFAVAAAVFTAIDQVDDNSKFRARFKREYGTFSLEGLDSLKADA